MTILKFAISALSIAGAITLAPSLQAQVATVHTPTQQAGQQDHDAHHPGPETAQPPKPAETPAGGMHARMMADMKEQDTKVDALVTKMNAATGNG